ncbi:MAG: hypothetical protein BHV69_02470 [Bacteroidales bacterium 52_46]|nr:MAG: hypothetical protein BHV69_02470 [Bacteroidales bacterium 52_46]
MELMLWKLKNRFIFVMHIASRSPIWARGGCRHDTGAFICAHSWLFGISQILISVRNEATVDAFSGMVYSGGSVVRRHCHIIQREASALLFLLRWAMREPRKAGRVTIQAFTLLFHKPVSSIREAYRTR